MPASIQPIMRCITARQQRFLPPAEPANTPTRQPAIGMSSKHYNNLVAGEAEPLGTSGVALRRAFEERLVADYDLVENATMAEASELTAQARIMLDAIRQKWGFAA